MDNKTWCRGAGGCGCHFVFIEFHFRSSEIPDWRGGLTLGVALGTLLVPEGGLSLNIKIWLADDSVSNARNKSDVTSFNKRLALSVVLA